VSAASSCQLRKEGAGEGGLGGDWRRADGTTERSVRPESPTDSRPKFRTRNQHLRNHTALTPISARPPRTSSAAHQALGSCVVVLAVQAVDVAELTLSDGISPHGSP
jgi:hypothetical protein